MTNFLLDATEIEPIKITMLGLYSDGTIRDSDGTLICNLPEEGKQVVRDRIDVWKKHIVPTVDCRDCKLFDNTDYCQYAGECTTLICKYSDFHCKYFVRKDP